MLLSLHIENVAVIKELNVDFSEGFTALTGETGAGKSVLIDSINILLGARAERELIRSGESALTVSGLFGDFSESELSRIASLGTEPDEDGRLYIQRSVGTDGRSQVRINGRMVNLSLLKAISPILLSVHGQSDTTSLTDPAMHGVILDTYASLNTLLAEYSLAFAEYDKIQREIKDITARARESERLREILEFQIKDIEKTGPRIGEEDELLEKKRKLRATEKITKNSELVYKALRGSEKGSAAYLIDRSITALSQVSDVLPAYTEYSERLRDAFYQIEDIAEEVYAVIEDSEGDPEEALNKVESRLEKIARLKRKYGPTEEEVIAFLEKARAELDTLENSDALLRSLAKKEEVAYKRAEELAERLHAERKRYAAELEVKIKDTLEFLDMPKVVFFVSVEERDEDGRHALDEKGFDDIEFYISANRGAEAQSIARVASGGELARIMLALKSVICDKDGVMTVIFDEIDAGVSGKTARKIGIKLRELSKTTQLFCVTHSAQIASLADTHYLIRKSDVNGKTEAGIALLDYNGRVAELSRILGGINVTEAQREAARDMLAEQD
ncbi:MAG: DNA repair protein RecN [Clostridia bacterium]|nr:DNA repair protein RecN [Clostridia bacterium]